MLSFDNTEHAFAYQSNQDLKRAKFLFNSLGNPTLTKIGISLTHFAFKIGLPINGIIKKTLFKQFIGGENLEEASNNSLKIFKYGVGVILDYGVEGKTTEQEFEDATVSFMNAIQFAKGKAHIPFISIKVTGFGRFELLQKIDEGKQLNEEEKAEFERVKQRLIRICETAKQCGVMVLIDAEETWVQDPVDSLALEMMDLFNRNQTVVFNTYQLYRHDRFAFIKIQHETANQKGFILGAKLVRGAYMEKERKRAEELNYSSPIQPNKETCDADYNEALKYCINHYQNITTFVGTHNEKSCYHAVELMQKNNLENNSNKVFFSQLYGMSDNISFNLAYAKFNVSKYLPYGPVKDVVPYLMRRAQENTSVKGQTGRELGLILKELKRRQQL
jgi:proline dehydrogenase